MSIIKSIIKSKEDIKNIEKSVTEFQNMLQLIVDNKTKGLKGECDICGKLNDIKIS